MAGIRSYNHQQDTENSMENSSGSPPPKRRRGTEKRVISLPIKDLQEGFRVRGDHSTSAPPSDSWTWRKYGQKPIKGSPYPRGYYRCSSSKGCPARKQVERSKLNPNFLVVTYSCEHNHSSPASRKQHRRDVITSSSMANVITATESMSDEDEEYEEEDEGDEEEKKPKEEVLDTNQSQGQEASEFEWFEFEPTLFSTMLLDQCPISMEEKISNNNESAVDDELAMIFAAREDDSESLFADLGELPEFSTVFRREAAEQRRRSLETTAG